MDNSKPNDAAYRAVDSAVHWNVRGAVLRTVSRPVGEALDGAVWGVVFRAVARDECFAVRRAVGEDPDHPALKNFLGVLE